MPTLKDVARDAGVSIATVSCCLSGSRNVRLETRMRIMDSIEKLKYIPNASARSLKKSATNRIGVVLADIGEHYHAEIFKGISHCLQKNGYTTNVAFSDNAAYMECRIIEEFISQNVAGLLILTCMPDNRPFFQNRLERYGIPAVFIEHRPMGMDAYFAGFDNEKTLYHLTKQLLESHYRRIALVTGSRAYSSEADSIRGYQRALEERDIPFDSSLVQETNMSKGDSFQAVLANLNLDTLEAVVATSENIAYGILEACKVRGVSIQKQLQLIALGEESWNQSSRIPGMLHTARTAFTLGDQAARMLLLRIQSSPVGERSLYLEDRILKTPFRLPPPANRIPFPAALDNGTDPLRILMVDLSTSRSARLLAGGFTQDTDIPVELELVPHDRLLQAILQDAARTDHHYDVYMYDIVWLAYLAQNQLLADISGYIAGGSFPRDAVFPPNLENACWNGRYFGIPFVSGSHIMLYRRDLFEDHALARTYQKSCQFSLRPPRSWTEFNKAAEFFTRSRNPDSPTLYGTSLAGSMDEELAPEILVRLWSFGGTLWDRYNRAALDTPGCRKAFESLLQTASFVEGNPLEASIQKTVSDFSAGKTAMLITYSEYASQVSRSMYQNVIGQVGYSLLPGGTSVSVGWFLGLGPDTEKRKEAFRFFDWLCRESTGYYMTIMGGQPPVMAPYRSHELLQLYPWLELTQPGFSRSRKRTGPSAPNALVIPQNRIEQVLCGAFKDVLTGRLPLEDSLTKWQRELERLFQSYGYPKPLHFLDCPMGHA